MSGADNSAKLDGKEPELPAAYYTHKRSSLLASAALLVLSISPKEKPPTLSYEGASITLGGDVVLFILAWGAIFYCGYFAVLWATDRGAYMRAKLGRHPQLEHDISASAERLKASSELLQATAKSMKFTCENIAFTNFYDQMKSALGHPEADEVMRRNGLTVEDVGLLASKFQSEAHPYFEDPARVQPERLYAEIAAKYVNAYLLNLPSRIGQALKPLNVLPADEARTFEAGFVGLADSLKSQAAADEHAAADLANISKVLRRSVTLVRLRVDFLDLAPCILMLVIAIAHYSRTIRDADPLQHRRYSTVAPSGRQVGLLNSASPC